MKTTKPKKSMHVRLLLLAIPIVATIAYAGYCRSRIIAMGAVTVPAASETDVETSDVFDDRVSDEDFVASALAREKKLARKIDEKQNRSTLALKYSPKSYYNAHANQLESELSKISPDQVDLRSEMERQLDEAYEDAPRR